MIPQKPDNIYAEAPEIDYKNLLIKYIALVIEGNNSTFFYSDEVIPISDKEMQELRDLGEDARNMIDNRKAYLINF